MTRQEYLDQRKQMFENHRLRQEDAAEQETVRRPRRGDAKINRKITYEITCGTRAQLDALRRLGIASRELYNGANELLRQEFEAGEEIPDGGGLKKLIRLDDRLVRTYKDLAGYKVTGTLLWALAGRWQAAADVLRRYPDDEAVRCLADVPMPIPEGQRPELALRTGTCALSRDGITLPPDFLGLTVNTGFPEEVNAGGGITLGRIVLKPIGEDGYEVIADYSKSLQEPGESNE